MLNVHRNLLLNSLTYADTEGVALPMALVHAKTFRRLSLDAAYILCLKQGEYFLVE